jgi:tRNA(Arg) A34 adenosine deaminase TadA
MTVPDRASEAEMHRTFMRRAIELAESGMKAGSGGPFGAVVVRDGVIIGEGHNEVVTGCDPTAHAEMVAIRRACAKLGVFHLEGCVIYTSCEPCPMCLSAIYWAHLDKVYWAASHLDAAEAGFDDAFLYRELPLSMEERSMTFERMMASESRLVFEEYMAMEGRIQY